MMFFKLFTWFADHVVVKFLANNRTFQNFAVKTDSVLKEHSTKASAKGEEFIKNASKRGEELLKEKQVVEKASGAFASAKRFAEVFANEVKKDLKNIKTK